MGGLLTVSAFGATLRTTPRNDNGWFCASPSSVVAGANRAGEDRLAAPASAGASDGSGMRDQSHPISVARSTARARSSTSSFAYVLCRWERTVLVATPSLEL